MSRNQRLGLGLIVLSLGTVCHLGLSWHLQGEESPYPPLKASLRSLPLHFQAPDPKDANKRLVWQAEDLETPPELARQNDLHLDETLFRVYRCVSAGLEAKVYLAYSRVADDRKHHPIVCIRDVGGRPEDVPSRQLVPLGDAKRSAQRFRFLYDYHRPLTVYYWHYTLPLESRPGQSWLQVLHDKLSQLAPSVTVQVFVENPAQGDVVETSFLPALERPLRERVMPEGSAVGCHWLNIGVVKQ